MQNLSIMRNLSIRNITGSSCKRMNIHVNTVCHEVHGPLNCPPNSYILYSCIYTFYLVYCFFPLSSVLYLSTPVLIRTSSPAAALRETAVTCARHRGIVRSSCGMCKQVCSVPEEESSSTKATMEASAPAPSPLMVLSIFLKISNYSLLPGPSMPNILFK